VSKRSAERPIPIRKPVVEYDMLLAALPHPILVVGDENRIIYGNAAAEIFPAQR
jgi:two-component system, NtrC family, nitrogen regulation sensor histidine kinase GlnL